jgi:hypothetical protein
MKLFALGFLVFGICLASLAAVPGWAGNAVSFTASWPRAAFAAIGLVLCVYGIRGVSRSPLDAADPAHAARLARGRKRSKAWGAAFVVLGIDFVGLAATPAFALGTVQLRGWAAAGFVVAGLALMLVGGALLVGDRLAAGLASENRIAAGPRGRATILEMKDTGTSINDAPYVDFDFEVSIPGRPPYRAKHRCLVPRLAVGRLLPKGSLPVRVDPTNPQALRVDWDEP